MITPIVINLNFLLRKNLKRKILRVKCFAFLRFVFQCLKEYLQKIKISLVEKKSIK